MNDTQRLELVGRHRLIEQLMFAGLEVALPVRDCGIDLLLYSAGAEQAPFVAHPIQLKAATNEVFSIAQKYKRFSGLVLVYAWRVTEPGAGSMLAMTYHEALAVASDMGYTATKSWKEREVYSVTSISERLSTRLKPFVVEPKGWRRAQEMWSLDPVAVARDAAQGNERALAQLDAWLERQGVPIDPGPKAPDWSDWEGEAAKASGQGAKFTSSDRQALRRLLTVHRRKDRFVENHWSAELNSGHVIALVRDLAAAPLESADPAEDV